MGWASRLAAALARPRRRGLVVAAPVEETLLASARALRRLGARLTRYDAEAGTLEAQLTRWGRPRVLRLRVAAEGEERTRVLMEGDVVGWWLLMARFRAELESPGQP